MKFVQYLKNRLEEKSTYAAIGIAVAGAAGLSAPWSYVFVGIGVIGTLVPTKGKDDDCQ